MKCPVCTETQLALTERQGIEIDYCPACRGVWLDRGELDKLIERGATQATGQAPVQRQPDCQDSHHGGGYSRHRKKSWLGEIFD